MRLSSVIQTESLFFGLVEHVQRLPLLLPLSSLRSQLLSELSESLDPRITQQQELSTQNRLEDLLLGPGERRTSLADTDLSELVSGLHSLLDALANGAGSKESSSKGISGSVGVDNGGGGEGSDGEDGGLAGLGGGDNGRLGALGDDDETGQRRDLLRGGELEGNLGDVLGL